MTAPTPYKYKYSIVACARWEADDIVEWLEYHRAVGFDHVFLYSNDDDPFVLRQRVEPYLYGASPFVTYLHWPFIGQQLQIYLDFIRRYKDSTEWITFLDVDEFYTFRNCDNVHTFMGEFKDRYDSVHFNWLIFGNNNHINRDPSLHILPNYVRRSRKVNVHTKNLVRTRSIDGKAIASQFYSLGTPAFWHFWDQYKVPGMRMTNVLHESVEGYSADFPRRALLFVERAGFTESCLSKAYISHFQFKSEEDFLRRYRRGGWIASSEHWRRVYEDGRYRNILASSNEVEDVYLARFWTAYIGEYRCDTAYAPVPRPDLENVALGRPAIQSSVYEPTGPEPPRAHLRGHGNDGIRTGTYGFHTQLEDNPWWIVDLLHIYNIGDIHIYNRGDDRLCAKRADSLTVECSIDCATWVTVHEPNTSSSVDGCLPAPLIIRPPPSTLARFVRVSLKTRDFLHLDEVEVYGKSYHKSHEPRASLAHEDPVPAAYR